MDRSEHETTRAVTRRRSDRHLPDERPYLVGIAGEHAGRFLPLEGLKEIVLGRTPDCEVSILLDRDVSRRHARLTIDEASRAWLADLGSKNGTLVNGRELRGPTLLRRGDRIFLGDSTIFKLDWLSDDEMERWQSASVDALTECFNRAFFDMRLEEMFELARERGAPLALIMCDVDHFKRVNDTHGHQAGDHVLQQVATVIQREAEKRGADDLSFRYGGEEFCVLVPGAGAERGRVVAEAIRSGLEGVKMEFEGEGIRVTLSAGVAALDEGTFETPGALLRLADENLYRAKREGRNRVV